MPILPAEPDIFPDDLLELLPSGEAPSLQWWAVYTLPRREKEFMRRLRALKISHYGPMIKHRHRSPAGRLRTSYIPLFPSYVFLCGDETARHEAMTTNCVSRCIAVNDPAQLTHDLLQISRLIRSQRPLTPESKLLPGMRVRIRSGVLSGTEGTVVKRHGTTRLVIAVQFLQQGASLLLEDLDLEEISA